jgi:hypothetical protein
MAGDITLSSAVRSNLLALQNTADLLGKTQEKLATGLKVNSALDDPTAFFTASSLNSRANDLSRLQDFVGNAVQTIKAADEGISAITKLVESAEATARQALQSAGNTASQTGDVDITSSGFDFAATDTSTNDVTAATHDDFTATHQGNAALTSANFDDFAATQQGNAAITALNFEDFAAVATGGDISGGIGGGDDGDTFTISANGLTTADITINTGDDADDVNTKIDAALLAAGITGLSTANTGGAVEITSDGANFTVNEGTGAAAALGLATTENVAENSLTIANGDTFTIDTGAGAQTITFGDDGGAGEVNTLAELTAAIDAISGADASIDGSNFLVITTDGGENLTTAEGTNSPLAKLGITAAATTATNTLGIENGDTFSISVDGGVATTITFGEDGGSGEVNTLAELTAAIDGVTGVTASVDGSDFLVIESTDGGDVTLTDGVNTPLATLGQTASTEVAVNSLGIENGDSFSVQVGSAAAVTITYGTDGGSNEVNTTAELLDALNAISNVSAEIDENDKLVISTTNGDNLTIAEGTNTPAAALGLTVGETVADSSTGIENGDTFTVQVGSAAATTITFGSDTGEVNTSAELLTALNEISDLSASITDDGYLKLEATNGEDLTTAEGTNTPLADIGITAATATAAQNNDRTAFATQFNELRSQIDQLANDASYNGINLLDGDSLTVTFNEDATSSLSVTGVNFNSNGLGVGSAVNTFQTDGDINAALTDLNSATDTLRSQASKFGSNLSVVETRQDFTKNLINVLETGAANLTLADTNEEGANLLALQTRQQLSSTALSLASQADQNVLRLF